MIWEILKTQNNNNNNNFLKILISFVCLNVALPNYGPHT